MSCVPWPGRNKWEVTRHQISDCTLEFASQRRGHGPESEGQQEMKAFGESGQVGWGWRTGDWDLDGVVDNARF